MEVCARCKVKVADFKCENCLSSFCAGCDTYLHSLPTKLNHNRIFINPTIKNIPNNLNSNVNSISTIDYNTNNLINNIQNNINTNLNTSSNIFPTSEYMSKKYVNEIKEIYEKEKSDLKKKIIDLTNELNTTKKNLEERIDYLHSHLDEVNLKNKNDLEKINIEHKTQMNSIISEKDNQIQYLLEEINKQKNLIAELKKQNKDFEMIINQNKEEYCNEINNLNCELQNLCNEKNSMECFYKNKINEVSNMYKCEKEKIIDNYEMTISKLNDGYIDSKEKYLQVIQERENNFKEYEKNSNKEKNELNSIIDKLKEVNLTSEKDQNDLIKMNDNLKQALEQLNNELGRTKEDLKYFNKENKKLMKKNTKMLGENAEIKKANDTLHGYVYGRFGKNKN